MVLIRQLTIFSGIVVLVTSLVTPLVCQLMLAWWETLPFPFSRIFDRVAMLVAVIQLWVMRRSFRLKELRQGMVRSGEVSRDLLIGLLLTSSIGVGVCLFLIGNGTLVWGDKSLLYLLRKFVILIPTALFIATLEELFFRWLLLRTVARFTPLGLAMVLTSIFYAFVHFITPLKTFVYESGDWSAGIEYVGKVVARLGSFEILPGVFGLFLVGLILADAVRWRKSLSLAIGLHAGWIVALKFAAYTAAIAPGNSAANGIGRRYFLLGEWSGWLSFVVVWLVVRVIVVPYLENLKRRERQTVKNETRRVELESSRAF